MLCYVLPTGYICSYSTNVIVAYWWYWPICNEYGNICPRRLGLYVQAEYGRECELQLIYSVTIEAIGWDS